MNQATIPPMPDRVRAIIAQVGAEHGMSVGEMVGESRMKPHAHARFKAIFRVHSEIRIAGAPPSLPQVGRWFNRDHTTIPNALRRHAEMDPDAVRDVAFKKPPAEHRHQMRQDMAEALA